MLGHFHASLLGVSFLCALAMPANVSAQAPRFSDVFLSDARITHSGKPVAVRIADPFARIDQERALLKFLNAPHTDGWDSQTTLADIQRDVGKHIALQIDHRALQDIGVRADQVLFAESGASATKKRPTKTPMKDPFGSRQEDPFGGHPASDAQPRKPLRGVVTALTTTSTQQHWWDRKTTTPPAEQMTNAAKLFHGLASADLVLATWSGRWLITTEDAADQKLSTRLYDVTPIANIESRNANRGGFRGANVSSSDVLMDVVHITVDPDTWERLGGPSSSHQLVINDRTWLVISAPVMTHWKVQALLNRLNGS